MSCYENLVMKTQMNYSRHYSTYASGGTAVVLSKQKPLSYEEQIQEFVDHFIMKLRMIRFLRTPAYDELFPATPPGSPNPLGAAPQTADTWLPKCPTVTCTPW